MTQYSALIQPNRKTHLWALEHIFHKTTRLSFLILSHFFAAFTRPYFRIETKRLKFSFIKLDLFNVVHCFGDYIFVKSDPYFSINLCPPLMVLF